MITKLCRIFAVTILWGLGCSAYAQSESSLKQTKQFIHRYYPASLGNAFAKNPQQFLNFAKSQSTAKRKPGPMRIALDPGHLGGNYSFLEDRLIAQQSDKSLRLSEGDLALDIAQRLKGILNRHHVEVLITRDQRGTSSTGQSFDQWKSDETQAEADIEKVAMAFIPQEQQQSQIEYWKLLLRQTRASAIDNLRFGTTEYLNYKKLFNQVFLKIDWQNRIQLINSFEPDLTFIIHLNVNGPHDTQTGLYRGTENNRHMAFISGGIALEELQKSSSAEALKIQLSNQKILDQSLKICEKFTTELSAKSGVPVVAMDEIKDYFYLAPNVSVPVMSTEGHFKGVFARNLALNRGLKSPSCYGESFMMDNVEFARNMQDRQFYNKTINTIVSAYFEAAREAGRLLKSRNN